MDKLLKIIEEKGNKEYIKLLQEAIVNMVCNKNEPLELSEDLIYEALKLEGEFLILKLKYDDLEKEKKEQKVKYKLNQSLSIIIVFEDDGSYYNDIKEFAKYIRDHIDDKQNYIIGVKSTKKISIYPITILFSGILPINQLQMLIGEDLYNLLDSEKEYFQPRFKQLRNDISKEIGITILPLFPKLDPTLPPNRVKLFDNIENKIISEFDVDPDADKNGLEIYLLKLFYIYKKLALELKTRV